MIRNIAFDPFVPLAALLVIAGFAAVLMAFAAWRGLRGWPWRAVAAIGVVTALANPALHQELRDPLTDIVILVVDDSDSQSLSDRAQQVAFARAQIEARIARLADTELRVVHVRDGADNRGTLLMSRLAEAMANEPRGRLAGAILLSDGQLHDADIAVDFPAPLHLLVTGRSTDWDRRLLVQNAPSFAILDEEVILTLLVEDQGAVPTNIGDTSQIIVAIDGGPAQSYTIPVGRPIEVPVVLPHGGMNVIQFTLPDMEGELTNRNNSAMVQINGVRDRLRVLLVSGEPHNGERTWRNLLKSDASVDLVHFTILRPPTKQDGVPVNELSLIAFPTRELFMEKVDDFDLIIFDRYKLRGILPGDYLDNIARYVEDGGAVLFAAGPDFATADSIYRSALSRVIPAAPTGIVIEKGYKPRLTETGARHPVTEGLGGLSAATDEPEWGRWFRQIELEPQSGEVVMSGADGQPLLILDRVGEGRVAVLGSDHAWLWTRGIEGGGPQLELLRRLAHWMMKEPELEEEALTATVEGNAMTITRRTLSNGARSVEVEAPDGRITALTLDEASPGRFTATFEGSQMGLYRIVDGDEQAVTVLGPAAPREFEETIATRDRLAPVVAATRGGVLALADGVPDIRRVAQGRPAAGRGWIGITPREAYVTQSTSLKPLVSPLMWLVILAALSVFAWLREGRR
ncbi:hypothetical protein [Celeribacter marinus]|uniref:Threonine dehydrogenase and related Zn-dependent dehydrogenase n=1 Tax=Celeribacter marinus TaxID=1397108 RepID=A0A0N7HIG0_9RHOB|nr:hypothetical protein [Celeribacter marinus]ALI55117.1 threonine dehydrogenase and related Zn-dependent dehydrogenase [Celeribacter marinus]SFK07427.1 hypothetical protein SAMN05444421_101319 [Celeribacter marinus]